MAHLLRYKQNTPLMASYLTVAARKPVSMVYYFNSDILYNNYNLTKPEFRLKRQILNGKYPESDIYNNYSAYLNYEGKALCLDTSSSYWTINQEWRIMNAIKTIQKLEFIADNIQSTRISLNNQTPQEFLKSNPNLRRDDPELYVVCIILDELRVNNARKKHIELSHLKPLYTSILMEIANEMNCVLTTGTVYRTVNCGTTSIVSKIDTRYQKITKFNS